MLSYVLDKKEKMDELVRSESKRIYYEEGYQEGIDKNTTDIIINMLKNKLDIQMIVKISGKSVDEIEQIKKDNQSILL